MHPLAPYALRQSYVRRSLSLRRWRLGSLSSLLKLTEQAETHSFAGLYKRLEPYVKDPVKRFDVCLRCKRGYSDTSQAGSFSKDQVYLEGAMKLLQMRRTIDMRELYIGKVEVEDLTRAKRFSTSKDLVTPPFMFDYNAYLKTLDEIAAANFV